MCGHMGQPTNYSLMNEVYETERIVSIQSEDRQDEMYTASQKSDTDIIDCNFGKD